VSPLEGPDVVPRKEGALTAEDKSRLTSQGIPGECWGDDVQLMEARYRREAKRFSLLPPECGDGLTRQSVMERIRALVQNTDKPGGEEQLPIHGHSYIHSRYTVYYMMKEDFKICLGLGFTM